VPVIEGAGVELSYEESGSGPAVLFVHGATGTRSIWDETLEALGGGVRAIVYDRRGYGESGAPEGYLGTTFEEQAEDAMALLDGVAGGRALVCGHSLGAGVCLDLMKRHASALAGAVLLEPPVLSLSAAGSEAMAATREALERGAREGGPAGAVEGFLRSWGDPVLDRLGPDRVEAAFSAPRALAADLAAASTWQFTRRELGAMVTPGIVITGTLSPPAWQESAEALSGLLGSSELQRCESGHFIPLEAPEAVAASILTLSEGTPGPAAAYR